jgi:NAD(P)-dependent dehydrogenase (short-subunit alcohol dehydrogenase family)
LTTTDRTRRLDGRRLLVVGATSGVGRAIAAGAAAAGARVVAVGRRADRLDDLVAEGHGDLVGVRADVRVEDDCRRIVEETVDVLGGLDALVYASGVSPLGRLVDTGADDWHAVFETNVMGAALVCRHAVGHLEASNGRALFLSSVSVEDPRPFLVPYGASKAALNALIRGWRNEHPHLCFTRIVVGPTATEFGTDWNPATVNAFAAVRAERGLVKATVMTADEVAGEVLDALASPVWVEDLALMPRNHPDPSAT